MDVALPRVRTSVRRALTTVAAVLLVTAGLLALTLPDGTEVGHWWLAWSGLDVATATTALVTAGLVRRGDPRAALTASAGAALLLLDAWFDVTTAATSAQLWLAGVEAVALELPLAVLALRLACSCLRSARTPAERPAPVLHRV